MQLVDVVGLRSYRTDLMPSLVVKSAGTSNANQIPVIVPIQAPYLHTRHCIKGQRVESTDRALN